MITMIIILIRVFKCYDHNDHNLVISTKIEILGRETNILPQTTRKPRQINKEIIRKVRMIIRKIRIIIRKIPLFNLIKKNENESFRG